MISFICSSRADKTNLQDRNQITGWGRGMEELSGVMEMFYSLIEVLVMQRYITH